jgi:hypothetical protein
MKGDKLSEYLKEFLIESKGRNALIYEEVSKLVDMMKKEAKSNNIIYSVPIDEIDILKNYLPFRMNIQKKIGSIEFEGREFDNNGNLIKIVYWFKYKSEVIELKKPFDIFGYYLNKRDMNGYNKLFDMSAFFNDKSIMDYANKIRKLISDTKNTGDELGWDDVGNIDSDNAHYLGIHKGEPYKYSWFEDLYDDNDELVKTKRMTNYKLPNRNKISTMIHK